VACATQHIAAAPFKCTAMHKGLNICTAVKQLSVWRQNADADDFQDPSGNI